MIERTDSEKNTPIPIYDDGEYLKNNQTWHSEDSSYKAKLVIETIIKNSINFTNCADVGCGSGLVAEILARHYPTISFVGFEESTDAWKFINQRAKLENLSFRNTNFFRHK